MKHYSNFENKKIGTSDSLNYFPKVIQLVSRRVRTRTHICLIVAFIVFTAKLYCLHHNGQPVQWIRLWSTRGAVLLVSQVRAGYTAALYSTTGSCGLLNGWIHRDIGIRAPGGKELLCRMRCPGKWLSAVWNIIAISNVSIRGGCKPFPTSYLTSYIEVLLKWLGC